MPKLTGLVVVRNHLSLDYIPSLAVASMLPVCDEVVVSDMSSDDGSFEDLKKTWGGNSKVRIVSQPWSKPFRELNWWVDSINYARKEFVDQGGWLLHLDGDEVLAENCESFIALAMDNKEPILFKRLNFWRDAQHIVPENRACGEMVARCGPANLYLPSDEPHPLVEPNLRTTATPKSGCEIFHYGFLRDPEAFIRKSLVVQNAFFGSCDDRVVNHWKDKEYDFFDGLPLREFYGQHPTVAHQWLNERGYKTQ